MHAREAKAAAILDAFAADTGLTSGSPPRRYLWTDAFAAATWLGLHARSGEPRFLELALALVRQVHDVLGRYAPDDARRGPLLGGLRIGKPLPERAAHEPYDPELEWDRDGQYYHYLTKWIRTLSQAAKVTGEQRYRAQATDLAQAAHRAFVHPPRMYWKMSVDLSRPLVPSMGMHDPLDGLVICASLGLEAEAADLLAICAGRRWATDDPLGAGGLLVDALHLAHLAERRAELRPVLAQVLEDTQVSVEAVAVSGFAGLPAARRLAFRELGFALGLHAVEPLGEYANLARLQPHVRLASALEDFWAEPRNQSVGSWTEHRDINAVSLAAALAPYGAISIGR